MFDGVLKPSTQRQVNRHRASEGLRNVARASASAGMGADNVLTLADVMRSEKQTYRNKSADTYLRKQHQKVAIERLPYWMDRVDTDIAMARQCINQLHRCLMMTMFILGVVLCVLLVLTWQMVGGV